jgi:hypothetical protein
MRRWLPMLGAGALLCPGAAHAEWMEAQSPHFVVYADEKASEIREFSEQLERFNSAMALVTGVADEAPSPSNRVTVYVVSNQRDVQRLLGGGAATRYVGGFYMPRAGGPLAFVPKVHTSDKTIDQSMIILLHEYGHHFQLSNSTFPPPRWLGEGQAEFFSSARFGADGGVTLGLPNTLRYGELVYARNVTVEELVDPDLYEKKNTQLGTDSFYGKSWALYHYLVFEPSRRGQLHRYLQLLAAGQHSREAAEAAFGDLRQLDRDLDAYIRRPKLLSMVLKPQAVSIGRIDVRPLRPGEAAMMPVRMRSRRGVTAEQAKEVVEDARKIAARYPTDPVVLAALSEAEVDAGNDQQAVAAADAALALDPKQVRAYIEKGYALFREAAKAEGDKAAAYQKAVAPFVALNKLENDNPLPLIYYYRSFADRGAKPPAQAVLGLRRAAELAPYDLDLRLNLAEYDIGAGDYADARNNLVPIAYEPHGSSLSAGARKLIERIDSGSPPDAKEAAAIMQPPAAAASAAGNASQ